MKTVIAVLAIRDDLRWQSLREILPAIERAWRAASSPRFEVRVIPLRSRHDVLRNLPLLSRADRIALTGLSDGSVTALGLLREHFGVTTPLLIHLHGDPSAACAAWEPFRRLLRANDEFIAASRAEKRALALSFPLARCHVVPFAIVPGSRGARRQAARPLPFLYVGRVSAQKNLHTLLAALAIVEARRPGLIPVLEVYGGQDHLGSPNMGLSSRGYQRSLERLARKLGIGHRIRWQGQKSPGAIRAIQESRAHVLVSPSLHADENFGVAALRSLLAGNTAVLSAWGGHLDFAGSFSDQVVCVPVRETRLGPVVSPAELAVALELAATRARRGSGRNAGAARYGAVAVGRELRRTAQASRRGATGSLAPSALYAALQKRKRRLGFRKKRIFSDYADPLARPFFEAYGMKDALSARGRRLLLMPWVKISGECIRVADPHKGVYCRKVAASRADAWLARHGFAFPHED